MAKYLVTRRISKFLHTTNIRRDTVPVDAQCIAQLLTVEKNVEFKESHYSSLNESTDPSVSITILWNDCEHPDCTILAVEDIEMLHFTNFQYDEVTTISESHVQ